MSANAESEQPEAADAADDRQTDEIPAWKQQEVEELTAFLERYDAVGIVDVTGIPSRQLQAMRRDLHGTAALRIARNTLIARALTDVDEGLEALEEFVSGQVGLIGTDQNPFTLYQQLEASKTPAPIAAGETAPNDIVIEAGDTGIDPGPFVGDLQQVGANARIEGGSIHVVEDSTVLTQGETVTADLAGVLSELEIEPKEVGLDLRGVYADGVMFDPSELDIDIAAYQADIETGVARARTLALETGYPTAATVGTMLAMATGDATGVGVAAAVESPSLADDLVATADAQRRALAAAIDDEDALPETARDTETAGDADTETVDEQDESTDDDSDAESDTDETETETDADADADTDADSEGAEDSDDGDGGDALGDMFG